MTPWIAKPVPFNIGQGAAAASSGIDCSNYPSAGGTDAYGLGSGSRTRAGIELQTSNPAIGKANPTITFYLFRQGNPSGNCVLQIYQGTSLEATGSNIACSAVSDAEVTAYDFTITHTLAEDDRIVLEMTGGDGDNQINLRTSNLGSYDSSYYNKGIDYSPWATKLVNTWWCFG